MAKTDTITIEGVEFITTRQAARQSTFTHDYIARLAREGRIVGMQVGRAWFVDPVSVSRFVETKTYEKQSKAQHIQQVRKVEQSLRQSQQIATQSTTNFRTRVLMAAQACLVLFFGVFVGFGQYFFMNNADSFLAAMHIPFSLSETHLAEEVSNQSSDSDVATTVSTSTTIVGDSNRTPLPARYSTTTTYVQSWFADTVRVVWYSETVGALVSYIELTDFEQAPQDLYFAVDVANNPSVWFE